MIEMQPFQSFHSASMRSGRAKRQPKPSALAPSIQNFKQQQQRHQRRHKNHFHALEDTHYESLPSAHNLNSLPCVLPSGKKLSLSIAIRKKHNRKAKKRPAPRIQTVKQQQPTVPDNSTFAFGGDDLLQKFLMAAKELNKQQEQEREKVPKSLMSLSSLRECQEEKREARVQVQAGESEKATRICERGRMLGNRVQSLLAEMIYL